MGQKVISFVGKSYAKENFLFHFDETNPICPPECKLYPTCMKNLKPNSVYRVSKVIGKSRECPYDLHEELMVLVELKQPKLEVSMENKDIFLGSIVRYEKIECSKKDCPHFKHCVPPSVIIKGGQRVKVVDKVKRIKNCPIGLHLSLVLLKKKEN